MRAIARLINNATMRPVLIIAAMFATGLIGLGSYIMVMTSIGWSSGGDRISYAIFYIYLVGAPICVLAVWVRACIPVKVLRRSPLIRSLTALGLAWLVAEVLGFIGWYIWNVYPWADPKVFRDLLISVLFFAFALSLLLATIDMSARVEE